MFWQVFLRLQRVVKLSFVEQYKLLTVTHKRIPLTQLSSFYVSRQGDTLERDQRLLDLQRHFDLDELFYLETCNRVVYLFTAERSLDADFITAFFAHINAELPREGEEGVLRIVQAYEGLPAIAYLHEIAASMDSLVVGEREILRQLRHAFEHCQQLGLTGDDLRIAFKFAIPAAKRIYTETRIAENPVSVVSLAARTLRDARLPAPTRILLIGAGQTMQLMAKFLRPMGFNHYAVFNRTLVHAASLAESLGGRAYALDQLSGYNQGFDVLITCTGATASLLSPETYSRLLQGDSSRKLVIDLAIPADVDPAVPGAFPMHYVGMESLRSAAEANLAGRVEELEKARLMIAGFVEEFRSAWQMRQVERMFSNIPAEVSRLRRRAVDEVFARDLQQMDPSSRETLNKVLDYLERKFVALPVTGARQALEAQLKDGKLARSPLRRVAR
jgi:glutamyl-tRNA reductase